ncbi:hypothetical protein METBIDRAFT_12244 [Metschnikowia bicuspidata var. bicuspidata NRRL YB-4993]|uniref:Rho-GAP domain-containing protein n=1 Tax=Metschnikowia bicuspidata var. bicuspidata NRRL YB-4993 TaxID=869754 RepID=A0A1A0H7X0_9ASCO|nr:hypothetical protein METBIDRAFT_12244 [Metschnikowia bicuspidata var. bicuspidata NRRL YB-4993]OBA20194.1 hypothetical protein METBIDRAFT_12244 [Metschnikowia bicuspidata var. bicuspidata NRRL YB-4993]
MALISPASTEDAPASVAGVPLRKIAVGGVSAEFPALLVDCYQYILDHGLVEGIFRVSGSIKRMRDVTANYAAYRDWLAHGSPSPHDVSGVAKKFTRDYLASMGGLFPPPVLAQLRALFAAPAPPGSTPSLESCRSTSTSCSSGLESVLEEAAENTYPAPRSVADTLDAVAVLLVSKNLARKNAVFIYYLSVLRCVLAHQDETRMPNANLAIVFQQYLFETWVVAELQLYQGLLKFLLDHYDTFVAKYRLSLALLGGIDEPAPAADAGSVHSSEPVSSSPLTEYSLHQASPPKFSVYGSPEGGRSSLSQKFTSLWEAYATPASRARRFSFMSRGSGRSCDRLPLDPDPLPTAGPACSKVTLAAAQHQVISESGEPFPGPSPQDTEPRQTAPGTTSRTSFMVFLEAANDLGAPPKWAKQPVRAEPAGPRAASHSPDSLPRDHNPPSFPGAAKRQSIGRRFSLWLHKK